MIETPLLLRGCIEQGLAKWLHQTFRWGYGHGYDTVMAVSEAAEGKRFTDSHDADQGLRWALEQGWIESCGWQPTRQQQFTGVGGARITGKVAQSTKDFHLSCHTFEPVQEHKEAALAWASKALGLDDESKSDSNVESTSPPLSPVRSHA
jgi:hypothetical protein